MSENESARFIDAVIATCAAGAPEAIRIII
jgi:hypothetical protein